MDWADYLKTNDELPVLRAALDKMEDSKEKDQLSEMIREKERLTTQFYSIEIATTREDQGR